MNLWHKLVNIAASSQHPVEQALLVSLVFFIPAAAAAVLVQMLKHRFVQEVDGADFAIFKIRKLVLSYNWAPFAQICVTILSLLMAWAGDYLVKHPYSGEAFFGVAGILFAVATLLHRFAVSKAYNVLIDFLGYMRSKGAPPVAPITSDGIPSA